MTRQDERPAFGRVARFFVLSTLFITVAANGLWLVVGLMDRRMPNMHAWVRGSVWFALPLFICLPVLFVPILAFGQRVLHLRHPAVVVTVSAVIGVVPAAALTSILSGIWARSIQGDFTWLETVSNVVLSSETTLLTSAYMTAGAGIGWSYVKSFAGHSVNGPSQSSNGAP